MMNILDHQFQGPSNVSEVVKSAGLHHDLMKEYLGNISLAPPPPPPPSNTTATENNDYQVLDVCTGSADWAIDFAETYPSSHVTGFDIYQPTLYRELPANCTLELEDINRIGGIKYPNSKFNHVFVRRLGLEVRDWETVIKDLMRVTKPGGYIEITELDPTPCFYKPDKRPVDSDLWNGETHAIACTLKLQGIDLYAATSLGGILRNLKLEIEVERVVELPMGEWHSEPLMKEIGAMQFATLSKVYDEFNLNVYTRTMGRPYAEAMSISELHKNAVRREANAGHGYNKLYIYVVRKPETAT